MTATNYYHYTIGNSSAADGAWYVRSVPNHTHHDYGGHYHSNGNIEFTDHSVSYVYDYSRDIKKLQNMIRKLYALCNKAGLQDEGLEREIALLTQEKVDLDKLEKKQKEHLEDELFKI